LLCSALVSWFAFVVVVLLLLLCHRFSLQTLSFAARFLKLLLRLPILFNSGSGFVERSFHWRGIFSLV
jgi:predicted membrane protein